MLAGAAAGPACRTARIGWRCHANWCTLDFSKFEMQPSPNPKNLNCRSRELENRKTSSLCFLKTRFLVYKLFNIWFSGRRFFNFSGFGTTPSFVQYFKYEYLNSIFICPKLTTDL